MRGGCGALSILMVAVGIIGYLTWSADTCTVQLRPSAANVTFQGWGATQQCTQLTTGTANGLVRLATLGMAGATQTAPSGETICSGFRGIMRYQVRDTSFTGAYVVGRSLCDSLQQPAVSNPVASP